MPFKKKVLYRYKKSNAVVSAASVVFGYVCLTWSCQVEWLAFVKWMIAFIDDEKGKKTSFGP
jgi:hypothetical protein